MRRGGDEGCVSSLMTAAVEREVSDSYFFSFFFDLSSIFIRENISIGAYFYETGMGAEKKILGSYKEAYLMP
jgi:hypothetical protein